MYSGKVNALVALATLATVQPRRLTASLPALRISNQSGVSPLASRKSELLEVMTSFSCTVLEA